MSQTVITKAFEQLKAQQAANGSIVLLDEFVFANVPDLNITDPIDRNESLPAESLIVHRQAVSKTGMVNENAVVYSVAMGADTGDFEFNWIGLLHKESNTVAMIVHAPLQKKIKTAAGQQGNVLTRSFLMEYSGASQQTQIITPADTWQIDFTARLSAVDERIRQENVDVWGAAGFIADGFLLTHDTGNKYTLKNGAGYVSGLRAELLASQALTIASRPSKVWVDVCWRGTLTSEWRAETKITVADALADYTLGDERHFVFAVAEVDAGGNVSDLRPVGSEAERRLALTGVVKELAGLVPEASRLLGFDDAKALMQYPLSAFMVAFLDKKDREGACEYLGLDNLAGSFLSRRYPFADIAEDGDDAINTARKNLKIYDGTTSQKGLVQLNGGVTNEDNTKAATPGAVKIAYDKAVSAETIAKTPLKQVVLDMRQSRVLGVTYKNNTDYPIDVFVRVSGGTSSSVYAYVNDIEFGGGHSTASNSSTAAAFFTVPVGAEYRAVAGAGALTIWSERR